MKKKSMLLASLAALALGAMRGNGAEVSVSLFYDALEPHGEWIEAADYGYVWTPRGVDADWRPYTDGQWVYTDAGWTWVSDEPYSWAVYHYGRWVNLERVGWSWVPDTEWGPAWVSWRHSDKYVGWAPLPPESRETIRIGVNLGNWVDTYYDIGPTCYSFVEVRNLGAPRLRAVVLPPRENITIINQTTNITNVTVRNNIVVNEGPDFNVISRQSAQPIRRLKLNREVDIAGDARAVQGDGFRTRIQGDSLAIPAPRVQAATADLKPNKVARRVESVTVNRGWRDAGDAQKVEAFRTKLQAEAKPPGNLPPIQRRDQAERGAAGADRPTARTGNEADTNARPPGATREVKTPGDASRPTAGTGRNPAEEPNRPTADTTAPGNDPRAPGANRPGATNRPDAAERPGAAARPDRPDRPGAVERPGNDRPEGARVGNPRADQPDRPDHPDRPERPQGARGPGADRPGDAGNDRPGQSERAKPAPGGGAGPAASQGGGAAAPGAGGNKPGKAAEKGNKEKKDRE